MEYQVKLNVDERGDIMGAEIVGLPYTNMFTGETEPNFPFYVASTKAPCVTTGRWYYAGLGEGQRCKNLQDALHVGLYDTYQIAEGLKDGDTFVCKHRNREFRFRCQGVHVVLA